MFLKRLKTNIMKMLPKLSCFIVCIVLSMSSYAQINGISASKVSAFCVDQIPKHKLELEPTFNYAQSSSYWNNFDLIQQDSVYTSSSVSWRATYGVTDKLEIGLNTADSELSYLNLGMKYILADEGSLTFSMMTGLGLPLGNRVFDPNQVSIDDLANYGIGIISSYAINENASLDVNIQYQDYLKSLGDETGSAFFLNADFGQYILDRKLMLILGAGYQNLAKNDFKQTLFTVFPGISIEAAENYLLVFTGSKSLFGYNNTNSWGISLSVTTILQ